MLVLHIYNSPANPEELFNLHHAMARNIVERIFGILKNRFGILRCNPNLDVDVQAKIAPALAAIHNVIREYDNADIEALLNEYDDDGPHVPLVAAEGVGEPNIGHGVGDLAEGPARTAERRRADDRRNHIADEMWQQYQAELHNRNLI